MGKQRERIDLPRDAPLTEVWIWENAVRRRVYRGSVQAHIDWKLDQYSKSRPELVEIDEPAST